MGFFSNFLGRAVQIVGRGLGIIPPAARAVAAAAPTAVRATARAARSVAPAVAGGVAGGVALGAVAGAVDGGVQVAAGTTAAMGMGGNGDTFRRTIVQTIDSRTGELRKQVVLAGAPHLMNRDLQIAKRVFRLSSKLHTRLPKRVIRPSRQKQLTMQVLDNALQRAALPCPTPALVHHGS